MTTVGVIGIVWGLALLLTEYSTLSRIHKSRQTGETWGDPELATVTRLGRDRFNRVVQWVTLLVIALLVVPYCLLLVSYTHGSLQIVSSVTVVLYLWYWWKDVRFSNEYYDRIRNGARKKIGKRAFVESVLAFTFVAMSMLYWVVFYLA